MLNAGPHHIVSSFQRFGFSDHQMGHRLNYISAKHAMPRRENAWLSQFWASDAFRICIFLLLLLSKSQPVVRNRQENDLYWTGGLFLFRE